MTPRRRNVLVGAIALAVVGLLVAGFFATHERVRVEQPTPPTAVAYANALHALTLGLRAAGQTVALKGHLDFRRAPPPPRGTLVLLYPEAQVETDDDAWALLDWVDQGGRLVLPMPMGEAAPSLSSMLTDAFGVEALRGAAADIDCARLRLPGVRTEDICGTPFRVQKGVDAAVWPTRTAARFARVRYGEGELLVLSDLRPLENLALYRMPTTGDAAIDDGNARNRDASTRLMAQLASPLLDGDAVWILSHRGGSLTALLWREGWPTLLGLALALLAWLLHATQRLGPPVPSPQAPRRALMEHIDAAGQFAFRNDHGAALHAALREAVLERLAQRHALARLDDAALAHALADRSRLPRETIAAALSLPHRATPEAFREVIAILASLLHRL